MLPTGKVIWLGGSGMQRSLMTKHFIDPQPCREWFEAAVRGKAKTPRRGEEFSFVRAPPLRWQWVLSQAFVDGLACGHQAFDSVDGFVEHRLLIFVHLNVDDALNTAAADDGRHAHIHAL